ncbi:MAG: hypothetical protein MSC52_09140 [Solobacterium sp.]|nr:hypothetical protein [Solobacterium sp.]
MLNIEKYKDEIKAEIEKDKTLGCVVNKLMGNTCDDYPKCNDCYLKVLDWLLQEYKEPILTDEEKVIIKNIIEAFEPFGKELSYITKERWDCGKNCCFLNFKYGDDNLGTLTFNQDKLFKGMEINKHYVLGGLGL